MIGTLLAIGIGIVVVAFAVFVIRGDISSASYRGRRTHSHYRRRF
jgi:hypothetical protein